MSLREEERCWRNRLAGMDGLEKYDLLLHLALQSGAELDPSLRQEPFRIPGCQSGLWLRLSAEDGHIRLQADSESLLVKGLATLLVLLWDGRPASEILAAELDFLEDPDLRRLLRGRSGGIKELIEKTLLFCREAETPEQIKPTGGTI